MSYFSENAIPQNIRDLQHRQQQLGASEMCPQFPAELLISLTISE